MIRFTMRDVLWLTVIAALAVSWRIDHQRIDKTVAEMKQQALKDEHRARLAREALEDERLVLQQASNELRRRIQNTIRLGP